MEQISQPAGQAVGPLSPKISDRQWAASAHLAALVMSLMTSWLAGIAGVVGAGAVYLIKREDSPFATEHAREAINFNLSMFIYACLAVALAVVLVGATVLTLGIGLILTIPAGILLVVAGCGIAIMWLVCSVVAAIKAWNGEPYRYPLTLRLLK
ncbi:MAG: hypothetical protein JWL98_2078 [Xanthomonadaceae bacterium]|nr:hypothetical protein [Xanthomonadaceae bacterium]